MGYSRANSASEGAVLIFANTAQEARRIMWSSGIGSDLTDDYIDMAVCWLRDKLWLFKEMKKDTPHVVSYPKSCTSCDIWGNSEIGTDGLCEDCREIEELDRQEAKE